MLKALTSVLNVTRQGVDMCTQRDPARMWFLFAEVDDAIITKMSTFGLTSFARTGRESSGDVPF